MIKKKEDNKNLEVFQGRTNRAVKVKQSENLFSRSEHKADGSVVYVPKDTTARGRSYRFHEGQHLNHSPKGGRKRMKGLNPDTQMAIEDVLLHTKYIPDDLPTSVVRDEKATALQDMRLAAWVFDRLNAEQAAQMGTNFQKMWNQSCIIALRSKAILDRGSVPSRKHRSRLPKNIDKVFNQVLRRMKVGMHKSAGKILEKMMLPVNSSGFQDKRPKGSIGEEDGQGDFSFKMPMSPPVGNLLIDDGIGQYIPTKDTEGGGGPKMPYEKLEMTVKTKSASHSRNYRYQSTGSQPSPFRLARASFSPVTNLFKVKMRKVEVGGSFLFNASGSMGVNGAALSLILEKIPAATVAYYSGKGLKVYAMDGKRNNDPHLKRDGGNEWDHQALKWLLEQPEPWFFITDEQFTGCSDPGQEVRCRELLKKNRKRIGMYQSYDHLMVDLQSGRLVKLMKEGKSK